MEYSYMSQETRKTNLEPWKPGHVVLHSVFEGDTDDECNYDPRVRAARVNNIILEQRNELPDSVVWCADAAQELRDLEAGKRQ